MPRPDLPFEPLFAPHIAPKKPTPTPVNWFRELAPRLPAPPSPDESDVILTEAAPGKARKATFRSVEEIASSELRQRQIGEPEPAEIMLLRNQAREEAQELIRQALTQAQILEEEARGRGHKAGYEKGYADGHHEAMNHVVQLAENERAAYREDIAAFLAHIEAERERAWEELEPQVIGMVFDLVKQVIKQEVQASRTVALSVVRNCLRRVADSGTLRIRVHADDLETVRNNREDLLTLVDGIRHLEIIEDRRVDAGGCVVETDNGTIDARLETQLKEVAETLEQAVKGGG